MTRWCRIRFQPNLPLGEGGKRVTACRKHIDLSRNAAKEGMVLLKNQQQLLPISHGTKLALFGKGTFDYVKGGGGSGDVTVEYIVNLYEGFKTLGEHVRVFEDLADYYRDYVRQQYDAGREPGMIPEPPVPQELLTQARAFTDTAVITISRFSGEGWDRGGKGQELFEKGDFYLSQAEKAMVEAVKATFPKVIVVMNVGGMVDTQWFCRDDSIQAVLMAWQGGMEGGIATAELLCGVGNPSGKLADTFAKELEDYPSAAGFHESVNYVDYTEDIFVGYRYFETIPGAADRVNYPFGYGLSYTSFDWAVESAGETDGVIEVKARVTNTGAYAGKEVLQLYVEAPQGKLGKAKRSLAAFQKTKQLAPGESQLLTLRCPVEAMASYDDLGKVIKSAYVLEKGAYHFHVGTSVRDTVELSYVYTLTEDRVTQQLSAKLVPTSLKRRMLADGSYEQLPVGQPRDPNFTQLPIQPEREKLGSLPAVRAVPSLIRDKYNEKSNWQLEDVAEGKITLDAFVAQLSDEQLAYLLGGQPNLGVANTWGFGNIPEFGVPSAMTADGPAGLRIKPECGVCTTAFPCATLLACTWDPEVTYAVGVAGAKEVKENNLAAWLTPAVNIHRSPLCGRNFEYYSEDPYLTGTMAAGMVRGIQSQRIAPSVKHFAFNNKETNRKNSDSRVSERAAREIYLKAFEIIVKTARPKYIMSAYNIVNGVRASENRELLEDILRQEWGFDGIVSTDWWTLAEHYKEVNAGNDLKMPTGFPDRLLQALEQGLTSREMLEVSAKRILQLLLWFE
jgi:beta-glucosidase